MTRREKKTVKIKNATDKKWKGSKKGKYAIRKFNKWLKERGYTVLGKECEERKHSGGWPDFIVRKGEKGKIKFFELKSGRHQVDKHQIEVLKILKEMRKVYIYRFNGKNFKDETEKWLG